MIAGIILNFSVGNTLASSGSMSQELLLVGPPATFIKTSRSSPLLLAAKYGQKKNNSDTRNASTKIQSLKQGKIETHRDRFGKITYIKKYDHEAANHYELAMEKDRDHYKHLEKDQAITELAKARMKHEAKMMKRAALYDAAPSADIDARAKHLVMDSGGVTVDGILVKIDSGYRDGEYRVGVVKAATKYLYKAGMEALAKLQKSGIVHTDPHTGNVVLDQHLVPRLIDFDQAKLRGEKEQAQYDKLLIPAVGGSPRYAHESVWKKSAGGMGNDGRPLDGKKSYTDHKTDAYYYAKSLSIKYEAPEHRSQYDGRAPELRAATDILKTLNKQEQSEPPGTAGNEAITAIRNIIREELRELGRMEGID